MKHIFFTKLKVDVGQVVKTNYSDFKMIKVKVEKVTETQADYIVYGEVIEEWKERDNKIDDILS